MNRAAVMCVMLALTACGNSDDHPAVISGTSNDASEDRTNPGVDATSEAAPLDAPVEAAPPVDAPTDAPRDAMLDAPADAGLEADAPVDAPAEAASNVAQCCLAAGVYSVCGSSGTDCEPDAGFCAANQIAGQVVNCPACPPLDQYVQVPIPEPDAGPDADTADAAPTFYTLTCSGSTPFAISDVNGLVCVCPLNAARCLYGGPSHTSAGCF